ncbi:hypothetical protein LTR37_011826 [Vermiconidia calcicola]|uniref:Uncharacterized protein n=1 Tax=Vermiconidia calcicola TaxID=1690605 RepID=A0ACC3N0V6_9PEZI|nr:hypothetical protein LTR37_011826 [Vermiconidia calcicola]
MSEIILYDLPSQGRNACWSLNPWKARASLNYKGLSYKTEWIEYPDLAPTFQKLGIPKNDGSSSIYEYSSPAAKLPDGSYVMDSRKIAEALEKVQPEPSLHMDRGDVIDRTQAAVSGMLQNLGPIGMPRIPGRLLNPRSAEYFRESRAKRFGMSLEELGKSEKAGENAWKNAEPHMNELKNILNENKDGPYVLGSSPSFADMIIAGLWVFVKKLDNDGDLYDRGMKFDPSFSEHVKACQKWVERDD